MRLSGLKMNNVNKIKAAVDKLVKAKQLCATEPDDSHEKYAEECQKELDALLEELVPDPILARFYRVETYPELVNRMELHICRLQEKLPKFKDMLHPPPRGA